MAYDYIASRYRIRPYPGEKVHVLMGYGPGANWIPATIVNSRTDQHRVAYRIDGMGKLIHRNHPWSILYSSRPNPKPWIDENGKECHGPAVETPTWIIQADNEDNDEVVIKARLREQAHNIGRTLFSDVVFAATRAVKYDHLTQEQAQEEHDRDRELYPRD